MRIVSRLFTEHPAAVGESYVEHLRAALGFAAGLQVAALACAAHALLPFLFTRTASRRIELLHERMVRNRKAAMSPGSSKAISAVPAP